MIQETEVSGVDGVYQINVGLDVCVPATWLGNERFRDQTVAGKFLSSLGGNNQLRLWTRDNFGEDLLLSVRAGSIYYLG